MEEKLQDPAEEIIRLRRSISDLVSIFSLPALWVGGDASQVANTLLDALRGMLHLDFAFIQLRASNDEALVKGVRCAPSLNLTSEPNELGESFIDSMGADPSSWPPLVTRRAGDSDLTIVPLLIGLQGDIGVLLAGSKRAEFPEQPEKLILSVAANQAAIALREASLLEEQKRLATDLDRRVAQRTKELAESNQELELQVKLLQHLPVAAWTFTSDGILDFVNQGWLEYTGQTLDFVRSKPEAWMDAMHPEDRGGAVKAFLDGIRSGYGFTMETRFRRAHDGEYRWHLNRAVPLHDAEGNVVRFVGTSTDISDLKQVQENLRRAEEKTRLIVDSALDAVVTMDAEGIIRSWNDQAAVIFGWQQAEAIGQRMSELIIPEELRGPHDRGLRHFFASGEGPLLRRPFETTAVRRNGDQFPVELQVMPLRLGEEWFFSGFIRDITDAKLAQQRLRQSEFNLRQMTETIPEMLWSATPEGLIDYCNTRVLNYSGRSTEDIMGEGWANLVHPDDVDRAARIWTSCLATGEPYQVEVRVLHAADHTYRWCITSALPLLDEDSRILKWFGTVVDMHDWKQSQEELRKTQAELAHVTRVMTMGQFTASIAHEVNQPLSGILMNAGTCLRMLDSDPPNIDGARETARRTIRDGHRASDVIARLRDLFKKNETAEESVDLNSATREVIALSLSDLQSNGVLVHQDLAENLPAVKGDRIQIQQVILNLLRNALDAMRDVDDRPRQLVIKTESDESKNVQLTVQDTGTGFAPNIANRLFESFYTTKADGMGIGLSISRSIIEAHRGRLWASPNDGPGSSFAFSIPYGSDGPVAP